jgi:hypothetical protein
MEVVAARSFAVDSRILGWFELGVTDRTLSLNLLLLAVSSEILWCSGRCKSLFIEDLVKFVSGERMLIQ